MVEENTPIPNNTPSEDKPAAPRRRRAPRQTAPAAQVNVQATEPVDAQEAATPAPRRTTRRRPAAAKADAPPVVDAPVDAAPTDPALKPTRRRRTAKSPNDAAVNPAPEPASDEPVATPAQPDAAVTTEASETPTAAPMAAAPEPSRRAARLVRPGELMQGAETEAPPRRELGAPAHDPDEPQSRDVAPPPSTPIADSVVTPETGADLTPPERPRRAAALVRPEPRADRKNDVQLAPARRRRRRRGSGSGGAQPDVAAAETPAAEPATAQTPTDAHTHEAATSDDNAPQPRRRRRGTRGGVGRRRQTAEQAVAGIPLAPEIDEDEEEPTMSPVERPRPRRRPARDLTEIDATPSDSRDISFMHPSEREFANLLDYYQIKYLYEPRSFPLRWDGNRVVEMHTPDFYLPEYDQYFELTTMKQSLVTQKNRKLRHVHELYPEVNIQLLYRRDLMRLMGKYGFGPLADVDVAGTERELYSEEQVQDRVREIGRQITQDYADQEPVLIGVLRGVVVFMADLMREIDLPLQIEFMEISHYGEEREEAIEVLRDVTTDLKGRPVIVVEDIVDTGLTLRYLLEYLESKRPSSVVVCCLLDKSVRRMAQVPLQYVGFEIGDEFVIGYGLDYGGRYRNLPYIGVLQPQEPKAIPQR